MHPSIIKAGAQLQSTSLHSWAHFGCPLCPKFITTQGETLRRHLAAHVQNAVHFQDTIICRCNLSCRDTGHYHCPNCTKTLVRKTDIAAHVTGCQSPCNNEPAPCETVSPAASSSLGFTSSEAMSSNKAPEPHCPQSAPEDCISTIINEDHCYTLSPKASLPPPSVTPQTSQPPPASPSASPSASPPAGEESSAARSETQLTCFRVPNLKSVKCPHCSIVLYKKNLSVHIQRKHAMLKDTAGSSHLEYVDRSCSTGTPGRGHLSRGESVVMILLRKINRD